MRWLPTNQASAALFLHRNTLHKYREKACSRLERTGFVRGRGVMPGTCTTLMPARRRSSSGPLTHHCVFSSLTAQGCTGLNVICRAM